MKAARRRSWLKTALLFSGGTALIMAAGLNWTTNTHAQASRPASIQFTNVTGPSGIKFVHFRGNDGIPINREIFGPGVCVADFDGDGLPVLIQRDILPDR